jgi:hypothetical protein
MLVIAGLAAACGRGAAPPAERPLLWPDDLEPAARAAVTTWVAEHPARPGEVVEREIVDAFAERVLMVERRRTARGCTEGWHRLVIDAAGAAREDGLGVTCCAGATCAADDPMAWMLRYQRAREDEDAAALAELIHPERGVAAVVEGLVYLERTGVTHRRDAAALLEDIEHTLLLHIDLRCDAGWAADGTASCEANPEMFPSTYRWRRTPAGVFLEALREGDGVE